MKLSELKALCEFVDNISAESANMSKINGFGNEPPPQKYPSGLSKKWFAHGFAAGMEHAACKMTSILAYARVDDAKLQARIPSMEEIKRMIKEIGDNPGYN